MTNNPLYGKLIEKVLTERPDLAPYAELFQQVSDSDSSDKSSDRSREIESKYKRLSSTARALKEDLEDALLELEDLANALGACEECWGEDKRCTKCRGKGKPGFIQPDKELFDKLILPALSKITWLEIREIKVIEKSRRPESRKAVVQKA